MFIAKINGLCYKSHGKGIEEAITLCFKAFAVEIKYPVGISVEA